MQKILLGLDSKVNAHQLSQFPRSHFLASFTIRLFDHSFGISPFVQIVFNGLNLISTVDVNSAFKSSA